jgi:hypothetical protein
MLESEEEDEVTPVPVINVTPKLAEADRVTITLQITHERFGEQPVAVVYAGSRVCEAKEQPFQRRVRHGEAWKPLLDVQGVALPGLVIIENRIPRARVQPTKEALAEEARKVVVILAEGDAEGVRIRPGSLAIVEFTNLAALRARCEHAETEIHITVFPR